MHQPLRKEVDVVARLRVAHDALEEHAVEQVAKVALALRLRHRRVRACVVLHVAQQPVAPAHQLAGVDREQSAPRRRVQVVVVHGAQIERAGRHQRRRRRGGARKRLFRAQQSSIAQMRAVEHGAMQPVHGGVGTRVRVAVDVRHAPFARDVCLVLYRVERRATDRHRRRRVAVVVVDGDGDDVEVRAPGGVGARDVRRRQRHPRSRVRRRRRRRRQRARHVHVSGYGAVAVAADELCVRALRDLSAACVVHRWCRRRRRRRREDGRLLK